MDGTLVRGDTLYELLFAALRHNPLILLHLPFWLLKGKAALKAGLARAVDPGGLALCFHEPVVAWLRAERAGGRRVVLATAADERVADAVAQQTGLFDEVIATHAGRNLRGAAKADELTARFGAGGFDYAGNDDADLPVWRAAREAIVVAPARAGIIPQARAAGRVAREIVVPGISARAVLMALRPHQWAKNALVFLPLLAAHRLGDGAALLASLLAFAAMSLVASAGYVANDLLDLQADRAHPRKRRRPFASGALPVTAGPPLAALLLACGGILAALVSPALVLWLGVYLVLTFTYSLWLKQRVLVDVFLLSALYTHRVLAGAIATGIAPSFWLLSFSIFFFLSLAMLKRYAELADRNGKVAPDGSGAIVRGYRAVDLGPLLALGTASAFAAVFVLALYIQSDNLRILYRTPELFWLCCPLALYWLSRMWIGAGRGAIDDDPLVFALRDRVSLLTLALMALLALLSATVDFGCPFNLCQG